MKPAVFLDRDGVINSYVMHQEFGTIDSPANPEEFSLIAGVDAALCRLRNLGYTLVVVSNQPGIAKGRFSNSILEATTAKMRSLCSGTLSAVYYCLHHPAALVEEYRTVCGCRKPAPGLLLQAAHEMDLELDSSFMVGDGITDVLAGHSAGVRTIFIGARKCYNCAEFSKAKIHPDFIAEDLSSAADLIENIRSGHSIDSKYSACEIP